MIIVGFIVVTLLAIVVGTLGALGLAMTHAALADALDHRKAASAAGRPVGSLWTHLREVVRLARQPAHA